MRCSNRLAPLYVCLFPFRRLSQLHLMATVARWRFGFRINIKYTQCNERIYANNCFWPRDRLQAATAATFKLQQLQHLQGALGKQRRENDGAGQVAGNRPVVNSDLMAMAEEDGGRGRGRQRERQLLPARPYLTARQLCTHTAASSRSWSTCRYCCWPCSNGSGSGYVLCALRLRQLHGETVTSTCYGCC